MSDQPSIDFEATLAESRAMQGALGALAYGILKGLSLGGAEEKVVGSMRVVMQEHLMRLSDADCNVLCDVVFARLQEDAQKGRWY